MPKLTYRVNQEEAVRLIRSGASDAEIMETFHLSPLGLQKLFRKLVEAHAIRQSELDDRICVPRRSHPLDKTDDPASSSPSALSNTRQAGTEVNYDTATIDLTGKCNPPSGVVGSYQQKSPSPAKTTPVRLNEERIGRPGGRSDGGGSWSGHGLSMETSRKRGKIEFAETFLGFLRRRKLAFAVLGGGATCLVLLTWLLPLTGLVGGIVALPEKLLGRSLPGIAGDGDSAKKTEDVLSTLEGIANDRSSPETSKAAADSLALQDCLDECKRSSAGADDLGRAALGNCRKECMDSHSELFKKIRKRYHGATE